MSKNRHDWKIKSFSDKQSNDLCKAFHGFYNIQQILKDIISEETKNDDDVVLAIIDDWKKSSIQFSDIIRFYGGFRLFDPLIVAALDNIRTDYNYFARSTSTWSDHRRLMNLCETIDAVAPVLDKIHKNGKTQNTIFESSGHYNSIHDVMLESMDECKKRKDGWILLSDVGNNLSKKGVKYEGKLCDICKSLGFEMRTEYTPGTNTGCQIYFIR